MTSIMASFKSLAHLLYQNPKKLGGSSIAFLFYIYYFHIKQREFSPSIANRVYALSDPMLKQLTQTKNISFKPLQRKIIRSESLPKLRIRHTPLLIQTRKLTDEYIIGRLKFCSICGDNFTTYQGSLISCIFKNYYAEVSYNSKIDKILTQIGNYFLVIKNNEILYFRRKCLEH